MTTVLVKKKDGQLIKKSVTASARPKATKEVVAEIRQEINERKKLVPNKMKRMAVISLAKFKSLSFLDALQIINKADEKFVVQKTQQKLPAPPPKVYPPSRGKTVKPKKGSPRLHNHAAIFITKKVKPKVVSGGLPSLGKRR